MPRSSLSHIFASGETRWSAIIVKQVPKDAAFQEQEVEEDGQGIMLDIRVRELFTVWLNDVASVLYHGRLNQQHTHCSRRRL